MAPASKCVSVCTWILHKVCRSTLKRFDTVISDSRVSEQFLWRVARRTSEVVPIPIDVAAFRAGTHRALWCDGRSHVVFLGRLVPRKGCEFLLRAVHEIPKQDRQAVKVHVFGIGPLYRRLTALKDSLGLAETVVFEGFLDEEKKAQVLRSAQLAVFPSWCAESFGVVLLEAMAAGAGFSLGGDNPGYECVLGESPLSLVNPRDSITFANRVGTVLNREQAAQAVGEWQRNKVWEFDVNRIGPRILQHYDAAVG